MAVEQESVERMMEWLVPGGSVRSTNAAADALVEKLAALVFQGDSDWPSGIDRAAGYRAGLSEWFAGDGAGESRFAVLTAPDADPNAFVDWFVHVVADWESRATLHADAGAASRGAENPNHDGTPGTEYYRFDEAAQEYQYSTSEDGPDWATYEQRRYSEPVEDENYGLRYRYDRRDGVYEWHDEAAGTWQNQAWADQRVAGRQAAATQAAPAQGDLEKAVEAEVAAVVAEIEGAEDLTAAELAEIRAELVAEFGDGAATATREGA